MEKLVAQVVKCLESGGIISLPTETVYSLSVNANNERAVEKIYNLKGRRKDNPLALFVGSIQSAMEVVEFNKNAEILVKAFLPGPLTLVLPKKKHTKISNLVNEGLETLAVRMPDHKTTLAILNAADFPIIGTSANPSGVAPAINSGQVKEYFQDKIDMIVDGGNASVGIASTIIDLCQPVPLLLRQGSITAMQIEEQLGIKIKVRD